MRRGTAGRLGRHASVGLLRARSPLRSASTCSRSAKVSIATASTTTRTSAAGSGWRSTPPCQASSPTPSRTVCRSSPRWRALRCRYSRRRCSSLLQALVLLPAFGLVYAVGVSHVLGPRVVLRRSLQYALANRTLTVLIVAAGDRAGAVARPRSGSDARRDRHGQFGAVPGCLIDRVGGDLPYRERARQWLDQRFFREEYDARKILLSLASRVRFETDPADLAAMVVDQIDEALHPRMARDPGGRDRGRSAVAGDGAARQRGIAAGRRRARCRCCAGPTNRSTSC